MRTGQRIAEAFERWYKRMLSTGFDPNDLKGEMSMAYAAGWLAATRFHKAKEREEQGARRAAFHRGPFGNTEDM